MENKYDYLIVGAGLFGSTFAYEMTKAGKKCLIIESKEHIAGNCYTENKDGINIHTYGPHIFHTNDKDIWEWVNQFAEFNNYRHCVRVSYDDKMYSFPINLMTLNQLWNVKTPEEAKTKLKSVSIPNDNPENLEEWILSQVGEDIYKTFVKGYTTKQWGKSPKELPTFIIKRLPIRTSFDDNYYFDKYQGIPIGGYTKMFEKMLEGIEVRTGVDYFLDKEYYDSIAKKVVFTGKIDEFFDYQFGELEYRTLSFVNERLDVEDYQGCAQVNYGDENVPYTRITEHKHFEKNDSKVTWISKEYSMKYKRGDIPYYPINDEKNNKVYSQYKELSKQHPNVIFGGRLSEYKYYDMHQIIGSALNKVKKELKNMDKKLILATGSDLKYLSNKLLLRLLESIEVNSNFDKNYLIFLNKFQISTPFTKTQICLIEEESIAKKTSTNCLQHGEFLNSKEFNNLCDDSDIICFIDGDVEVQRNLSKDEIDFLKNFKNGDVYVGYNAGPNDMLMDEFPRLGPKKSLPPVFENALDYKVYNTGVVIMNKYSWNKLKDLYIELFDEVDSLFHAYPKQQWLISFLIQESKFFKIHEMPYDFHNHNHYGSPEGTVIKDGVVTHNDKVALFKHKWI